MAQTNQSKASDMAFLLMVIDAIKQGPIDYQAVATKAGLPNAKAAKNKLYNIQKKHGDSSASDDATKATPTKKQPFSKSSTSAKKRKLDDVPEADDELETPVKKSHDKEQLVKVDAEGDDWE